MSRKSDFIAKRMLQKCSLFQERNTFVHLVLDISFRTLHTFRTSRVFERFMCIKLAFCSLFGEVLGHPLQAMVGIQLQANLVDLEAS